MHRLERFVDHPATSVAVVVIMIIVLALIGGDNHQKAVDTASTTATAEPVLLVWEDPTPLDTLLYNDEADTLYPEGLLQRIPGVTTHGGRVTCAKGMTTVPVRLDGMLTLNGGWVMSTVVEGGIEIEAERLLSKVVVAVVVNHSSAVQLPYESLSRRPNSFFSLSDQDWGLLESIELCV